MLLVDEVLAVLEPDLPDAAHDLRQRPVDPDRLASAIEDSHVATAGDDRREHGERDVEPGTRLRWNASVKM